MRKNISLFLSFLILFMAIAPALSAAAMTKAQVAAYWTNVCKTAKTDAEKEVNGLLWMGAGCVISWVGIVLAYVIKPAPMAERLIGKPAAYATQYTKCYEQRGGEIQQGNAWAGFAIEAGIAVIYMILVFTVFAQAVSTLPVYP